MSIHAETPHWLVKKRPPELPHRLYSLEVIKWPMFLVFYGPDDSPDGLLVKSSSLWSSAGGKGRTAEGMGGRGKGTPV